MNYKVKISYILIGVVVGMVSQSLLQTAMIKVTLKASNDPGYLEWCAKKFNKKNKKAGLANDSI